MGNKDRTDAWGCDLMRYEADGFPDALAWTKAQPALVDALCATVPEPSGLGDLWAAVDTYALAECTLELGHGGPHRFPTAPLLAPQGG